jgi:glycosyltransferase involved in cell wall biosynthesis
MSLVSIVIPAYNQERFVAQAIASALGQTHPWVEVIVVDVGSTDQTGEIAEHFDDHANLTVVRQPNGGLPAARNRGLAEARGEFVCFLDSDDYLAPTYLERLLQPLVADPAVAMAYCDVQMVDLDGEPAGDFSVATARRIVTGDIFESLLIGGYFPPHTVVLRRSVLADAGPFDLALGGHADYELWLRLSALGHRAHYVDARLAFYRVYDGSMSRDVAQMRDSRVLALERIASHFPHRMARGLSAVQELTVDLHAANTWLQTQSAAFVDNDGVEASTVWALLDCVDDARQIAGNAEQFNLWDVPNGSGLVRCVYLHPPASLHCVIPIGAAGRITASVSLHPDVWEKPEGSGCLFTLTVDDVVVGSALLDPTKRVGDRRWISLVLDVPASTQGSHTLVLETSVVGTGYFAWGLFRDVEFRAGQDQSAA